MNNPIDDCYFSEESGFDESLWVFIRGNNLEERMMESRELVIAETGFGTGLNLAVLEDFLCTLKVEKRKITYISVEKYPLSVKETEKMLTPFKERHDETIKKHIELISLLNRDLKPGWNSLEVLRPWGLLELHLFIGDVLDYLKKLPVKPEAWFLDGHSPDKNPDMWNSSVFKGIAENSAKEATLATFTAAGLVKQGLREAGFFIKRRKGFGSKRHMITGKLTLSSSV